ncbi:hypothetical protein C5167_043159 [Papaver somniferum]|uniref:Uncharacterized protein n=1 Tax=Papaver somniferum TaxID=3469 RepID=A0A4Y7L7F1_PAPSO|nr:hypothetical protein C5167_043159 [Papaver somniferum]
MRIIGASGDELVCREIELLVEEGQEIDGMESVVVTMSSEVVAWVLKNLVRQQFRGGNHSPCNRWSKDEIPFFPEQQKSSVFLLQVLLEQQHSNICNLCYTYNSQQHGNTLIFLSSSVPAEANL